MESSFDIKVYLGCLRQNVYNEHTYVESKFDENGINDNLSIVNLRLDNYISSFFMRQTAIKIFEMSLFMNKNKMGGVDISTQSLANLSNIQNQVLERR